MSDENLRARLSAAIGRAELLGLGERLDRLETAVAEERTFLPALADQVVRLEADLLPVLERAHEERG